MWIVRLAFVSTLSICIVFVPVAFLSGMVLLLVHTPRHWRQAVTLPIVDTIVTNREYDASTANTTPSASAGEVFWRLHAASNQRFKTLRQRHHYAAAWTLGHGP